MLKHQGFSIPSGFLAVAGLMLASGVTLAGHGGVYYGGYGYRPYAGIGYRPGYYGGFNRGLGYSYAGYGRGYGLYGYGRGLPFGGYGLGYGYGGMGRGIGWYGLGLGAGLGLGYGIGSGGYGLGGYGLGGYGGYGYAGSGLGYGGYVPGYGGYTAGYGGYSYATPYAGNGFAAPSIGANPPVNPNADYYSSTQPQQPPANDNTAHLMVVVPEGAELWFNGTKTSVTGAKREFVTPALTPGKDFTYHIKARWMENGKPVEQTQSVQVQANAWKVVDFTGQPMPEVPER